MKPITLSAAIVLGGSIAFTTLSSTAIAACITDDEAVALVDNFLDRKPAKNPEGLSEADGVCSRGKINNLLAMHMGKVVGYKAGLTNPAVQKRFNYDKPVRGTLYSNMLLESGATVDAAFGARPLFEADLLVRVKDATALVNAKTPMDVLLAIDQVIPFIELPDLVVEAPPKLNGPAVNAINVGAWLGVLGSPIAVPATRAERFAMLDGLRDMTVTVNDGATELGRGKGSDILEHPLNAVLWIVQDLAKENLALKAGDIVSLGSFSPLFPTKPGIKAVVNYQGLPGAQAVTVNFRWKLVLDLLQFTRLIAEPSASDIKSVTDKVSLPFDLRSRSRLRAMLASGEDVAIVLPRGSVMRSGSIIVTDDGVRSALVHGSDEPLLEVQANDAFGLLRAAYHLGNRHVQLQVLPGRLRLPYDYVLADMVTQMGAKALKISAPFDPEPGAYGNHPAHQH